MANVSLVDGHIDGITNFDRIRNMSIEEMAELFYSGIDKICFENCSKGTGNKFCCPIKDDATPENCINCVKRWLESEVTE